MLRAIVGFSKCLARRHPTTMAAVAQIEHAACIQHASAATVMERSIERHTMGCQPAPTRRTRFGSGCQFWPDILKEFRRRHRQDSTGP
jgi:hypothetical protein